MGDIAVPKKLMLNVVLKLNNLKGCKNQKAKLF